MAGIPRVAIGDERTRVQKAFCRFAGSRVGRLVGSRVDKLSGWQGVCLGVCLAGCLSGWQSVWQSV